MNLKPTFNGLFQITNLMHNSFIFQQYVYYTTLLNMFRAARCSSSGGQIVSPQPLVSSPSVNSRTVCRLRADWQHALHLHTVRLLTVGVDTRGCGDTICPPEDEQLVVSPLSTCILYGCLQRVTIPEAVVIQFVLLRMSSVLFETC